MVENTERLEVYPNLVKEPVVLGLYIVVAGAVAMIAASAVRLVRTDQRVVVSRLGQVHRVAGPGWVARWPGVESWHEVTLLPTRLSIGVTGTSLDGVPLHVQIAATCQLVDPAIACDSQRDPWLATQTEIESVAARSLSTMRVEDLLPSRPIQEARLQAAVSRASRGWGVEVTSFEIADIEVRLTMTLIESLRSGRPEGGT
jgi:regulator of protease activity HflC (stomatin/prohibitin superfamily)